MKIGKREIGHDRCFIIAEIGINANGSMDIAKAMIDVAAACGVDAVKFQKRTVEVVYTEQELDRPRPNPFGPTNGDLKRGLEFSVAQYEELGKYALAKDLAWGASCWDQYAVSDLVVKSTVRPSFLKIASPTLTDSTVRLAMKNAKDNDGIPVILSTGMSTVEEMNDALQELGPKNLLLMHCVSSYPTAPEDVNLLMIPSLARTGLPVGYSGHELGIELSVAAATLGAVAIERHFTLDGDMWGSDQDLSLNPEQLNRLVWEIREVETAMGSSLKCLWDCEKPARDKLRRV